MFLVKTILQKLGRLLLSIVRVLRRAFCCKRRRRESEMLLPLTVNYTLPTRNEVADFHDWNSWDENELNLSGVAPDASAILGNTNSMRNNLEEEDFFKDMVPQFRKPKKLIVKEPVEQSDVSGHSSRLSMDPRAFLIPQPELGLIEDNPTASQLDHWNEIENLDENWDADSLIREKKMAEREKRIAEHQRRKLEKESKRAYKQAAANTNSLYITEINERAKYS